MSPALYWLPLRCVFAKKNSVVLSSVSLTIALTAANKKLIVFSVG